MAGFQLDQACVQDHLAEANRVRCVFSSEAGSGGLLDAFGVELRVDEAVIAPGPAAGLAGFGGAGEELWVAFLFLGCGEVGAGDGERRLSHGDFRVAS